MQKIAFHLNSLQQGGVEGWWCFYSLLEAM